MNPLLIFIIFIAAFFVWICMSLLFPRIGGFVKDFYDALVGMMIDESESEDEDE